ncbi:MAG: hypothetical protein APF80_02960 [Alphaproteobacteria bacterium BRH_c36]|nr:MAG: hypothetical protein APF80_02960 [Alphaproteobacteria bacterium BRH_c36]
MGRVSVRGQRQLGGQYHRADAQEARAQIGAGAMAENSAAREKGAVRLSVQELDRCRSAPQ